MPRCLDEDACNEVTYMLGEQAKDWWFAHEGDLVELSTEELRALAGASSRWMLSKALPRVTQIRLSIAWRKHDPDSWRAWQKSTTATLQGVAKRRAEARARLHEAIGKAAGAVLRAVGAALKGVLGL